MMKRMMNSMKSQYMRVPSYGNNQAKTAKSSSVASHLTDSYAVRGAAGGIESIQTGAKRLIEINRKDRSALKDSDKIIVKVKEVGEGLSQLALAAKNRKREDLIMWGRKIHGTVAEIIKELRRIASTCRDPILQDKIYKQIAALSNFSIQLKILSAVKASNIDSDKDTEQLVSVATSLEKVLADSISTVNSVALL